MGDFYPHLDEKLSSFIKEQQMFFVATAMPEGRINLSPKGMDTFRILDESTVAYLDLTGSGNETSAHLSHDGRMTIMFCGFAKRTWIVRLYGQGWVVLPEHDEHALLMPHFVNYPGARQIIKLSIESIQSSCGFGVPKYDFVDQRSSLLKWAENKGEDALKTYRQQKNSVSIDGLPTKIS